MTGIMVIWNIAVIKKDKNPMIAVKNVSRKKIRAKKNGAFHKAPFFSFQ